MATLNSTPGTSTTQDCDPLQQNPDNHSQSWSIAELAAEFDVTHRALRYYESIGLLIPERVGNRRVYRQRDRVRLSLVLRGKRLGFDLDQIATIVNMYDQTPGEVGQLSYLLDQIDDRRSDLEKRRADLEAAVHELEILQERCRKQLAVLQNQDT